MVDERFYRRAQRNISEGDRWDSHARRTTCVQLRIVHGARIPMRILHRQTGHLSMAIEGESHSLNGRVHGAAIAIANRN